jgi:uncharacterized membrane protein YkvA (DUF1232 family)
VSPRWNRRWAWIGAVACVVYLLNPDAGFVELIPDNLPIVGNLDEAGATLLLVQCIRKIRAKDEPRA